ncbi:MAG TPA: rhomboid family intramembrane serine protease [Actinomycetales bacterium]|nr:rhomboid family intramembrane serine protease [Actinomycetales bacterium]
MRCQRCGRPTCPQCQRAASVGVHCVDCAKAAQARIRGPRTVAGAKVRGGNPVVTYALIGLCVVVFLGQMVGQGWVEAYGYFVPVLGERQPWRFLSSAFLHVGIWHIFLNMYAMYLVGPMLEHVLGRARYLTLWILAAIGGSVAVLLLADPTGPSWLTPVAGASGAVFGMFGALALTMRRMKRSDTQILVIIGINVVLGFVIPGISWQGHLGGLVVGVALAAAYLFAPKQHRTLVAVAASVGMAVLLVALAVAKYAGVF